MRQQTFRELLPKITPLFKPHRRYLFIALGLLLVITVSQLIGPLIVKFIIDRVIDVGNPGVAALTDAERIRLLLNAAAVYVALAALGSGVGYIQAITLFRMGINIVTDLKARLFKHVLYLGLDFHSEHPPGKLISRVESDAETLKELFSDVTVNLLRNLLTFFGILGILCWQNFAIAVWILLLVPVLFGATFWFISFMRPYWREWRTQWAVITGYVAEYVQGIDVIQQFNYQHRAKERMHEVNYGKYKVEVPASYIDYGFWGVFMYGEIVAIIIVLVVGVQSVGAGTLSIGTLVLFLLYISQMFQPIMQLSEQLNFIQRSLISVERVFSILETPVSITDGPRDASELSFKHEIAFENVWFAYEGETWVLRDVSFSIPKGQSLALVGKSGGGKSTIVNLLLRFYDPQKGRITVDGVDIREFELCAWRNVLGLVLQDIYLFPGSVADNIRVFNDDIPLAQVEKVAKIARADGIINKLPGKYSGELAERGGNLSVGERQLLSFARALPFDPPLLVLDEATSSVDPHTERLVQEALEHLLKGRTAVIVAHRLSTIQNAQRIMLVHNGEVAESGTHAELLALNGRYAKLHRLQFEFGAASTGAKPPGSISPATSAAGAGG